MTQRNTGVDVINGSVVLAVDLAMKAIELFVGANPNPPGQVQGKQPQITQEMIKRLGKGG
jgi:hypothetical protein